ncbi:MAG: bifunctional riboflavin kinase/FAD synthetase [Bosea sp. (in: a-proteobacteria)]
MTPRSEQSHAVAAPDARTPALWTGTGAVPERLRGAVCAIGNFDGLHLGHKALLAAAAEAGARLGRPVGLITFEPHPRSFFRPDVPVFRLSPAGLRRDLAAEHGCEAVAELPFNAAFAAQSAGRFIDDLLIGQLDVAGVAVGADFAFGRGREGDVTLLRRVLEASGRVVLVVPPVVDANGIAVSSSRIRTALAAGDVALANNLLGHRWRLRGEVVHGDKRGRLLGYPTANMVLSPGNQLRHGIYAVRLRIDGIWRPAVASFGSRPTFDDGAPRLESFVFDFAGDLYGQTLDVEFVGWIRPEEKFADMAALVAQMDRDSAEARRITA